MKGKYSVNIISASNSLATDKIENEKETVAKAYSLDAAIRLTGNGHFHIVIVLLSGFVLMGSSGENSSAGFILPYASCDLKLTINESALLASITFLGVVLTSHFWGFLADTWGRKNVIRLTAICAFITSFISSLLTNVVALVLFRFGVGLCISGLQVSVFSYVSEFHTKEAAQRASAIVSTFLMINIGYSAIIGWALIPMNWRLDLYFVTFTPWRLFIIMISLINLVNSIAFSILPESPKFLLAMDKEEEALMVLRSVYRMNTRKPEETYPVKYLLKESNTGNQLTLAKSFGDLLKLMWEQTKPLFLRPYVRNTLALCYLSIAMFGIGHGSFTWYPDFLIRLQSNTNSSRTFCEVVGVERKVLSSGDVCDIDNGNTMAYKVLLVSGVAFTILSGVLSFHLNRIGPKVLAPVWILLSAISVFALNYLTEFYSMAVFLDVFLSIGFCATIVAGISVNLFPVKYRAMSTCFIFMSGRLGGLAGANIIGAFLERNCTTMFNLFGVVAFSCVLVFLFVIKRPEEKNDHDDAGP